MTDPSAEQIRDLLEYTMSDAPAPLDWTDVERRTMQPSETRPGARRTVAWLACAASVAALVAGFVVVTGSGDDDTVRTHTPPTTASENSTVPSSVPNVTAAVTPTTAVDSEAGAEPTVASESAPTLAPTPTDSPAGELATLAMPRSGDTQQTLIGDITWTLVEGDASTQPTGVSAVIDGVFYGVEQDGRTTWRSPDGIQWELTDLTPNGVIGVFEMDGETWARRSTIEGQGLGRWDGEQFVPVELPEPLAPSIAGLRPTPSFSGDPIEFDDRWIIPVTTRLQLPWNELYDESLYPEWDIVTETVRLVDWESDQQRPVAVLTTDRVDGDPATIEFRDSETGELVVAVEEPPGVDPDRFFTQLVVQGGISYQEFLIRNGDGFESVAAPWPLADNVRLAAVDETLLAAVSSLTFEDGGFGNQTAELWASTDGRTWERRELPTPFGSRIDNVEIDADGSVALLTIVSSDGNLQRPETWWTADGIVWEPAEADAGFGGPRHTEIGWFRSDVFETGGLSVSADGLVWQEISFDIRPPAGAGGGGVNVMGGKIFVSYYEDGGERVLWVGQVADD